MLGYASSNFLVQAYMGLGNYEEAGKAVEDTIANYPGMMALMQQLPYAELIYVKTLKKPEKAIQIYEYALEKTENPKLKEMLREKIKALKSKK